MRVFLAGATGAIGRRLVPQLIASGHQVTATSRRPGNLDRLRALGADAVAGFGVASISRRGGRRQSPHPRAGLARQDRGRRGRHLDDNPDPRLVERACEARPRLAPDVAELARRLQARLDRSVDLTSLATIQWWRRRGSGDWLLGGILRRCRRLFQPRDTFCARRTSSTRGTATRSTWRRSLARLACRRPISAASFERRLGRRRCVTCSPAGWSAPQRCCGRPTTVSPTSASALGFRASGRSPRHSVACSDCPLARTALPTRPQLSARGFRRVCFAPGPVHA
jgi:hypothetical protein